MPKVSEGIFVFGVILILAGTFGPRVTISDTQLDLSAWWQRGIVVTLGAMLVIYAMLLASEPVRPALRTGKGFLGAPPRLPQHFVARPELSGHLLSVLTEGKSEALHPVGLWGMGGTGKSTLAVQACQDRRVRRRFPDGIVWVEVQPQQDSVALLADVGRRLGLSDADLGFSDLNGGRHVLSTAIQGKRLLIALDNVWERGPLDTLAGLTPTCQVLFTTRDEDLASIISSIGIKVDELTRPQALELLASWVGKPVNELSPEANRLCERLGNLVLGVAISGAMIQRRRTYTDVLDLIDQDPDRIRAELDPNYRYETLHAAIGAGISDLTEADQHRYHQLSVFMGRGSFPREAAHALWARQLSMPQTGDLLAQLVGRSLLSLVGNEWYIAHDLQYDVMARRLTKAQHKAAHRRLLDHYYRHYRQDWTQAVTDRYLASSLVSHLYAAGRQDELCELLSNLSWIHARLTSGQLADLIPDYRHTDDVLTRNVLRALRLSVHALRLGHEHVYVQLPARLMGHSDSDIITWVRRNTPLSFPPFSGHLT
ncbi:NB-ARC domain-containing protein [Nonomuraea sp. NPDC003707]